MDSGHLQLFKVGAIPYESDATTSKNSMKVGCLVQSPAKIYMEPNENSPQKDPFLRDSFPGLANGRALSAGVLFWVFV